MECTRAESQSQTDGSSSALRDFKVEAAKTRRHMVRITPQAERPVFVDALAVAKNGSEQLDSEKGGTEVQL